MLREPSWECSSNSDEGIFRVQKASLNMFWVYSPSSANIASDRLRAKSSPVDEEARKIKMDDGVDTSLASEGIYVFVALWDAQPCLREPNDILLLLLNYPVRDD